MPRPPWLESFIDRLCGHLPGRMLIGLARFLWRRVWPAARRRLAGLYQRLWPLRYRWKNLLSRARDRAIHHRYERDLRAGRAAGEYTYTLAGQQEAAPCVDLFFATDSANGISASEANAWCREQTLDEFRAQGQTRQGEEKWRIVRSGVGTAATHPEPAQWFYAPGRLPEVYPAFLESALLVALAEEVAAVILLERLEPLPVSSIKNAHGRDCRPFTLFNRRAYRYDPATDLVRPTREQRVIKVIGDQSSHGPDLTPERYNRHRRGPYLASQDLEPRLRIPVREIAELGCWPDEEDSRKSVLVLAPLLAHGGAEHTIFETLRALGERFVFTFVTLAPHRAELGDRRAAFEEISPRIFALGDLVHPVAMPSILSSLINQSNASILYNANGTTLFYDFVADLKTRHPGLRILDHLYDHKIGYIDRYTDARLLSSIDTVVAENHRIAELLIEERGWTPERVPVIWPCGRREDAFPAADEVGTVRRRIREELGLADNDILFLTAARMHEQKRPLDLVHLAARLRDVSNLQFLIVGGGPLESHVDRAIAIQNGAQVRRLPFRQDIPQLIAACDVGCLVSDYEGLPVFMIECLQSGRPFLGTNVGEMGRVLSQTRAGRVVATPGDLEALEQAVRALLDPTHRAELAAKAREAAREFSVTTCAERYANAFLGWNPEP